MQTVVALSCIFAGASGNLVDRVRLGEVIDFLDFYWKNHQWAAFNVADMAIFLGAFLYLAAGLMEKMRKYPRVIPLYEKAENEAIHGKNSGWNPYGK